MRSSFNSSEARLHIFEQLFVVTPVPLLVAVIGLVYLFVSKDGRLYQSLAWAYFVTLAVIIVMKGKNYYIVPAYPMVLAAGAGHRTGY